MKNYMHLHNLVFNQPHLCTPDYAETVLAVLSEKLNIEEGMFSIKTKAGEEKDESLKDGIYTLPIRGSMVHHGGMFDAMSGTMSYEGIQDSIQAALDNPEVNSILLDIDSSGGSVAGAFDLRDFIMEAKQQKPIYALARDTMASAAYLIGSAATKVYATQTAQVGSIGVVAMHVDQSERNKQEGIKPTFITAGGMKAAGNPHEPLEGEALDYLQESVNDSYEMFVNAVVEARGLDAQAIRDTEARVYKGQKAKSIGLVDGVRKLTTVRKELAGLSQKRVITQTKMSSVKGMKMDNEIDVEKLEAGLAEVTADLEATKANMEKLTAAVLAEGYTISEDQALVKAKEPEMIEVAGVLTDKATLPEHVVAALEAAAEEKAEASLKEEASKLLPNFSMKQATLLIKALTGFEGEEKAEFEAALKSADKAMADKLEEFGDADVDGNMDDPQAKLDAKIEAYMTEHSVDIHKARVKVLETKEGRELFKAAKKG